MAYLYELEGIYAKLQSMDLDDETFNDTLEIARVQRGIDLDEYWKETFIAH